MGNVNPPPPTTGMPATPSSGSRIEGPADDGAPPRKRGVYVAWSVRADASCPAPSVLIVADGVSLRVIGLWRTPGPARWGIGGRRRAQCAPSEALLE